MRLLLFPALFALAAVARAQTPACDMHDYKASPGLTAQTRATGLELSWQGERGESLRAVFAIRSGQPMVHELAVNGEILAHDLTPEYEVTSGRRRISEQQLAPLRALHLDTNAAYIEQQKWNAFWDAPLEIPGNKGANVDLPRRPEEIRRASATFAASGCKVKTNGARLEVTFPGVSMGIFAGDLIYTVYRGTNLVRQEVVAKTEQQSVAYKYRAGLKGFDINSSKRVAWQDVARAWQQYEFGGSVNTDPVALKARNRLAILETGGGSVAVFPPPHKFFWAREIEINLGYVYYRKDSENSLAIGIRHADREEAYKVIAVSDEVWQRRSSEARHDAGNFALYNAPPGTWQHMPVYFYLSPGDSVATQHEVLAFTHDDHYKPLPGYAVASGHFHTHTEEQLADQNTLDFQPTWVPTFRALGLNIVMMSDFHGDGHLLDPGPLRFKEEKVYFDGMRRLSDRNFLLMPGEEPDAFLGGHYTMIFPHPVYWSKVRKDGQPQTEQLAPYGHVYHIGSAAEELAMLQKEQGFVWQAHPRTKGSSGYPDAVREMPHFRSDRFLGGSYQSLPVDQSEKRLCEARCFGVLDDMNNWAGPKYMYAEGDTYMKNPDDETYPQLIVNYVKLDRVPRFDEDWSPILRALRAGDFWVTSGEVLFHNYGVEGVSGKRAWNADIEYTYPLEFAELVWGDGDKIGREIISATDLAPLGTHHFHVPFDAAGKKWVRFAVWDSAGNGAFTQPVHLR